MEPSSLRPAQPPPSPPRKVIRFPKKVKIFFTSNRFWVAVGSMATAAAVFIPIYLNCTGKKEKADSLVDIALTKMDGELGRIEISRQCRPTRQEKQKAEEAKQSIDEALRLQPRHPRAMTALGVYNLKLCRLEKAKAEFQRAMQKDRSLAAPRYNFGGTLWLEGKSKEALKYLEEARRLEPKNHRILFSLGIVQLKEGQHKEAAKTLEAAKTEDPSSVEIWEALGSAYYYDNQFENAVQTYQEAVDREPNNASARYNLGRTLWGMGKGRAAIEHLEYSVKEGGLQEAFPVFGLALYENGRRQEALDLLHDCTRKWSDHADCHEAYGVALMKEGAFSKAASEFKASLKTDPKDIENWHNLVSSLEKQCGNNL